MTPAQEICATRHLLVGRGWIQASFENEHGVCLGHAIARTCFSSEARRAVARALAPYAGEIVFWNDMPSRTFYDVVDLLDRAEKIAEECEVLV